jgi:glycosyltransferase involved in cell wall biosynthesis
MPRIKISVVLANYNGADFLKEAIEGAVNQSRLPDEIVLVDDGSTDESVEIIEDYASRYPNLVRPVFLDENRGQAAGFNAAMEHVTGELVAFLDSDDFWFPNKIENVAQAFEGGIDCAFYEHNLNMLREGEILDDLFHPSLRLGDIFGHCQQSREIPLFVPTSGLVFRRAILEKIMPIPAAFRTCADGFLTRTAMCFGPVLGTLEPLGAYRIHSSNHTFENTSFSIAEYLADLLIPQLNSFYAKHNIELSYPVPIRSPDHPSLDQEKRLLCDRILDASPRKLIHRIRRMANH